MLTIKAKQFDNRKNCDIAMLSLSNGWAIALIHMDVFLQETGRWSDMHKKLCDGEELTLSVAIAGEDE